MRRFAAVAIVALLVAFSALTVAGTSHRLGPDDVTITAGGAGREGRVATVLRRALARTSASYDPITNEITVREFGLLRPREVMSTAVLANHLPAGVYDVQVGSSRLAMTSPMAISDAPAATCAQAFDMLVVVPDFTWNAYNRYGGGSFYDGPTAVTGIVDVARPDGASYLRGAIPVHHHRAGYNPVAFLRASFPGKSMRIVAQSALDAHDYCVGNAGIIVLYGHDEYWSRAIRKKIHDAVRNGASLLNMSGNTDWWMVEIGGGQMRRLGYNHESDADESHEAMLGVSFRWAGYPIADKASKADAAGLLETLKAMGYGPTGSLDDVARQTRGLRVLDERHPLLKGTGLAQGQWLGVASKVVEVEFDGWPLDAAGRPVPQHGKGNVPHVIAEGFGLRDGVNRAGVMVAHRYGRGRVVTLGSVGWVGGLLQKDPVIETITRNAVELLSGPAPE